MTGRWLMPVRCMALPDPVRILALLLLLLGFPFRAAAQRIEGSVVDREDGTPVQRALVLLVDSEGRDVAGGLTDEGGSFRLEVPAPGQHRLRMLRIGYEAYRSDPVEVLEGQTVTIVLEVAKEAIELERIEVEATEECQLRPSEGRAVARVWEEVSKALTIQARTESQGLFRFRVSSYTRELDSRARRILDEDRSEIEMLSVSPMRGLPPEDLVEGGFVRELENGTFEYLAPDAEVLLSNAFLDAHCFRLATNEDDPSLIGLAFEPGSDPDLPDVVGTFWVDRMSGALSHLEFRYTWVPFGRGQDRAGGRLDFELIPNGAWIVRRWWIRMPTVERMDVYRTRLVGFKETGAEVIDVTPVGRRDGLPLHKRAPDRDGVTRCGRSRSAPGRR
jgi:hypothetical protein